MLRNLPPLVPGAGEGAHPALSQHVRPRRLLRPQRDQVRGCHYAKLFLNADCH